METETTIPNYYPILENAFGLLGTACWSFQLVPQVYKNWKNKSTIGFSPLMMLLWVFSGIALGIYTIILNLSIPLILQPQLMITMSMICCVQCLYYDQSEYFRGKKIKSIMLFVISFLSSGLVQTCIILGIKMVKVSWLETLAGTMSLVLPFISFIPQYYEIYRLKMVKGISFCFLAVDISGGVFFTISLVFRPPPFSKYILILLLYISIIVTDFSIVLLYYLLDWLHSRHRKHSDTASVEEEVV